MYRDRTNYPKCNLNEITDYPKRKNVIELLTTVPCESKQVGPLSQAIRAAKI